MLQLQLHVIFAIFFFLSSVFENQGCCSSAHMPQEQSLGFNLLSCVLILLGHRGTLRLVPRFPAVL